MTVIIITKITIITKRGAYQLTNDIGGKEYKSWSLIEQEKFVIIKENRTEN
jgi:hypothetical protein